MQQNSLRQRLTQEITSNWYKKLIGVSNPNPQLTHQYSEGSTHSDSDEQVLLKKKQLLDFTKRTAMEKVQCQQKINSLLEQMKSEKARNQTLSQSLAQLKEDHSKLQAYMLELRQSHQQQLTNSQQRNIMSLSAKQKQCHDLYCQLEELEKTTKYQKQQNQRYEQFLKIKEDIIKNLEWEKSLAYRENCSLPINNGNDGSSNRSHSKTKDIKNLIIRKKSNDSQSECQSVKSSHNEHRLDISGNLRTQRITIAKRNKTKQQYGKLYQQVLRQNQALKGRIQIMLIQLNHAKKSLQIESSKQKVLSSLQTQNIVLRLKDELTIKNSEIELLTNKLKEANNFSSNRSPIKPSVQNSKHADFKIIVQKCLLLESYIERLNKKLISSEQELSSYRTGGNHRRNIGDSSNQKSSFFDNSLKHGPREFSTDQLKESNHFLNFGGNYMESM